MKRFLLVALFLTTTALAVPAAAQASDAEAQKMMKYMPADEEGWSGGDEEGVAVEYPDAPLDEEPSFQAEQNPQDAIRRMPAPAPERAPQPAKR
ncbi:MAG: hypothetical protein ACK4PK_09230 [Alphaproteobacteria bacterium]|jgi:hypothetical protein